LLKKVVNKFKFSDNPEITVELNPDDATIEYLKALHDIGFNRISIGSQTFSDKLLKLAGRRHDSSQIINAVNSAKDVGFTNISLDLIYGLPTQTIDDIKYDLDKFINLDINHISTYGLKIEGGTYWSEHTPLNVPDDDLQADMYEIINSTLLKSGFERYEVSNFAKKGYESKHNLTYWNNEEYYGFGVSAHGYTDGIRYSNYCSLEKYMNNPCSHEYGRILTDKEKLEEEIFLGFRKTNGINTKKINEIYKINFEEKYKNILKKYNEFFIKTKDGYAFNLKGSMLSNEILPEFLN